MHLSFLLSFFNEYTDDNKIISIKAYLFPIFLIPIFTHMCSNVHVHNVLSK